MRHFCRLFGGLCTVFALSSATLARAESTVESTCPELAEKGIMCLDQGWDSKTRQKFYHTSQGSQFIRYEWIKALKLEGTTEPFLFPSSVEKFGYLSDPQDPERLPVGFTVDTEDSQGPINSKEQWLGMTCAACHTAEIHYQGKKLRIDGAPAMTNMMEFYRAMYRSLRAMCKKDELREQFVRAVLGKDFSPEKKDELLTEVADRLRHLKGQVGVHEWKGWIDKEEGSKEEGLNADESGPLCAEEEKNNFRETRKGRVKGDWNYVPPLTDSPVHPYGPGRVDAIGLLINELICHKTETWGNCAAPNAPVNYPSLWYTPRFKNLQWNGALKSSEGRNIGEALGVFVRFELPKGNVRDFGNSEDLFSSTLDLGGIKAMWADVEKLKPPPWPADWWGEPKPEKHKEGKDNETIKSGEVLYSQLCASCHSIMKSDTDSTSTENNQMKELHSYDAQTDEKMALNFLCRGAKPPLPDEFFPRTRALLGKLNKMKSTFKRFTSHEKTSEGWQAKLPKECKDKDQYVYKPEQTMRAHDWVTLFGAAITLKAKHKIGEAEEFSMNAASSIAKDLIKQSEEQGEKQKGYKAGPLEGYKAGPLDGIWATAPYLHNGSVPNLYQLLLPSTCPEKGEPGKDCRMKTFCLGSREFDPANVGFDTGDGDTCDGTFKFNTTIPGNSNSGHEDSKGKKVYGTTLSKEERENLIEYLKSL